MLSELPPEGFKYRVAATLSLKIKDIISLLSGSNIFLGSRRSEPKPLCQRQDKQSLCEPVFILQTKTKSDVQQCGAGGATDQFSQHGIFLRQLDVRCCGMINVIEKDTDVRVVV